MSIAALMPETKAKRISHLKSRNGCLTCKARRVKCDETKPLCKTCSKSSRTCNWSRGPQKAVEECPRRVVQRILLPQNASSQLCQVRPSGALTFVDQRELYYFWAYKEEAAVELSGQRKSSAWTRSILQACHTDPFVLRGVVAIGALNKFIKTSHAAVVETLSSRQIDQRVANHHRDFALQSYDKAIIGMRQIVPSNEKAESLRKALIACLLIETIERFLQSPTTSGIQANAGYELLHQWIAENPHGGTGLGSPDNSIVEDDIFHEFARSDLNFAMWWGERRLERHERRRKEGTATVRDMPSVFSNLDEARVYQELIARRTFHLIGETYTRIIDIKLNSGHAYTADSPGELVDPCHIPMILLGERDAYLEDIRRWCQAFQPIYGRFLVSPNPATSTGAALLRMHALDSEIALAGAYFTEESSFDAYLPEFKEIVSLARLVVKKLKQHEPTAQPVFNVHNGIEKPLYTTAVCCRSKLLRFEALELFRAIAHRDPSKYIPRMATKASYVVSLEEEGREQDGTIPEHARYRLIWVLHHYMEKCRDLTMLCCRRVGYPLGRGYPAKREWKIHTFTQREAEEIPDARKRYETINFDSQAWPSTLHKPGSVCWQEVHEELMSLRLDEVDTPD